MKKIQFLLALLLCCMVAEKVSAQIVTPPLVNPQLVNPQQAIQFARSIVGNDSCDYYLGLVSKVHHPDKPSLVINMAWLVFVDEEPNSGWEHPCKYVYIDANVEPAKSDYFVIDSVCPPDNVKLVPAYKPNRYGDKGTMKPYVPKVLSNNPNPAAGNTYAVILNGGMQMTSNHERYWNDCSFIYKTLINTYEIPKRNIKVIMSDGTNDGEDMNMIDGNFCSSPLDLDDDGSDDIEYAATKKNLQTVMNEMARKLTDDDHLMIFVTGHGGYDVREQSSYMYLWNREKLYPNELNSYLEPIDAGFISIVMGQCYSGGFIEPLKKTNRIIATACAENERSYGSTTIPFDEFLYHWISAVNGYDAYGNRLKVKEGISIVDAQAYAARNDVYANDKVKYGHEVPQINYFTHSVAYDLSLANIPPVVYLCIDDYRNPVNPEQRTVSYSKLPDSFFGHSDIFFRLYHQYDMRLCSSYRFWNCPYVWIRNKRDGDTNQYTEKLNVEFDDDDTGKVYAYYKICNKGVKSYTKKDKIIRGYWANSSIVINENKWKGYGNSDSIDADNLGGFIGFAKLSKEIPAGETYVGYLPIYFYNIREYVEQPDFNICTLIYIKDSGASNSMPIDEEGIALAWSSDKLGQSNVTFINNRVSEERLNVSIENLRLLSSEYSIEVCIDDSIKSLFSEANLSLLMSPDLVSSWKSGGAKNVDIEENKEENNAYYLNSAESRLIGLQLKPYQKGKIGLKCNFFANEEITEKKEYDVDVALVDDVTKKCLGGETFRIIQYPRPAISPQIESVRNNGKTTLTATNVSENVKYKWYDAQGTLVGEGETFAVPAGMSATSYKVKAEALSDGAISYSAPVQAESSSISSVQSTAGAVNVILEGPANSGTTLRLASATGNVPVTEYSVEAGSTVCDIPADNLPSGVYQVTMVENGVIVGIKKFTK